MKVDLDYRLISGFYGRGLSIVCCEQVGRIFSRSYAKNAE